MLLHHDHTQIFSFCPFNADTQEDGVELNIYNHAAALIAVLEKTRDYCKRLLLCISYAEHFPGSL